MSLWQRGEHGAKVEYLHSASLTFGAAITRFPMRSSKRHDDFGSRRINEKETITPDGLEPRLNSCD